VLFRFSLLNFCLLSCIFQNKKERKKVREVGILKKDPEAIREQIEKLEKMSKYISCIWNNDSENDVSRKYIVTLMNI